MAPNKRKYKKAYSFELLKIAEGDLNSAKALSAAKIGRPENILYLAQQAVEKTLKATLCFLEQPILHTHDLDVLVTLLSLVNSQPPEAHLLGTLTQYASNRRYEEGSEELSHEDFDACIKISENTINWAKTIIVAN